MANRFPLIIDTADNNKIKELPTGDNLDLTGNGITGVGGITASGTITANSIIATNITVDGSGSLATVATTGNYNDLIARPVIFSGSWNDLTDKPAIFSGDYNDLVNKPTVPSLTSDLTNDLGFITNATAAIPAGQIVGLATVATTNSYDDLDDLPTIPTSTSQLTNDADFVTLSALTSGTLAVEVNNSGKFLADDASVMLDSATKAIAGTFTGDISGSVFGDDSAKLVDSVASKITGEVDNTTVTTTNLFASSISSPDSSTISIVPAVTFNSDVVIENSLTVSGPTSFSDTVDFSGATVDGLTTIDNFIMQSSVITTTDSSEVRLLQDVEIGGALNVGSSITCDNITMQGDQLTPAGALRINTGDDIILDSPTRVKVLSSVFGLVRGTTDQINGLSAENGDMVYNTTTNKFQGYANGAWVDLH